MNASRMHHNTPMNRIHTRRSFWIALASVAGLSGLSGCREPLLSDQEARSQYDRYDALRDQRAPSTVEDEFGQPKPNLRGRLQRRN
jgi:hypothetical protein